MAQLLVPSMLRQKPSAQFKEIYYELDVPVIVGGVATATAALHDALGPPCISWFWWWCNTYNTQSLGIEIIMV